MFPLVFNVKTASAGYKNGATSLVPPWRLPGCVPYALSLGLLGHGPCSPGSGKCKSLPSFGILLEMQGQGDFGSQRGGFGSQMEPELRTWEMPALEQGSEAKKSSVSFLVSPRELQEGLRTYPSSLLPVNPAYTGLYERQLPCSACLLEYETCNRVHRLHIKSKMRESAHCKSLKCLFAAKLVQPVKRFSMTL